MLELYYNFLERFCDVNKLEDLEMDSDSLYLALSEKELCDCIREESEVEWELTRTEDCQDDFTANATTNFFPRTCCTKHKKHQDCGDGNLAKYRKVLDEFINVTSTNRGFRTVHHSVATYEPTKKELSDFYP